MIITTLEYAKRFPSKGKTLSSKTIARRCNDGLLPYDHHARQLPNESGSKGQWVIEIPDKSKEIVITKTNHAKPDIKTMNRKYFNW